MPEHSHLPTAPPSLQSCGAAGGERVGSPSEASNDRIPQHQRLHSGYLVEINRNGVNCRAWMSTTAPSLRKLARGERGTVLGSPFRFERHDWIKVRLEQLDTVGYVASRYLDVIEAREPPVPEISSSTGLPSGSRVRYRAGDLLTTSVQLGVRSGPGIHFPVVLNIPRNALGIALDAPTSSDSVAWVPVRFRAGSGWIATQHSRFFARRGKWIEVDLPRQELIAWDDEHRVSSSPISSGKAGYPTPADTFTIIKKIPVRRLRATVRGEDWDIPAVPWLLLFKRGGFYIHSAYWHDDFGTPVSHGCVTLPVDFAEWLFAWTPIDTPLWIHY